MGARDHFKNKASSKKLMSGVISILLAIVSIAMFSCEDKEKEEKEEKEEVILSFEGSGTSDDPFLIGTAAKLAKLAELVNAGNSYCKGKYYKLTADIDLNVVPYNTGKGWVPIGIDNKFDFAGYFDGNNQK